MAKKDTPKKSLLDWLGEFYEDTGTLSGLIRNLAFAGIGLIWIFRNSDLTHDILPKQLLTPLKFIVLSLISDVCQYLWRAITIYIVYKIKDIKHTNKKITDSEIADVTMPHFIAIGTWILFILKIVFVTIAYAHIYSFITTKV